MWTSILLSILILLSIFIQLLIISTLAVATSHPKLLQNFSLFF